MSPPTAVQFLRGVIGFLTLALTTPALFLVATVPQVPSGPIDLLVIILISFPGALLGIVAYPSWLLVALAGALALATLVTNVAARCWSFVCVFAGTAAIWSLLVPGFPQHKTLELAVSAAIAALLTLCFSKRLYFSSAT